MPSRPLRLIRVVLLAVVTAGFDSQTCLAQQPKDSLARDYATELPRLAPKEPAEALATFQVAPGFRIEQVAAEPLVASPVAASFDENSRLYIVEMRGYSENRGEKLSRIRRLVDNDGDGKFDASTIFADGLLWPTAVFCVSGGILVADAPEISFLKDTDGDGKADERRLLYTGLGHSNVQGLVNSFQWGLDNRIYAAVSSSGAQLQPAQDPTAKPLAIRGRDIAIDPRDWSISLVSGGAQHGLSVNDWGDRFVCSNSDHLQQILYEDRYLARNPYLAAPPPRKSIAADGPQADVFRTSPVEPWRVVRTRLRVTGVVKGAVEGGGRAAGYFTGATGVTIYRGDAWPAPLRGLAIVGDVGSNLVHRKQLVPEGIPFVGQRIDEKSEFVTSTDNWFRPVQFANAPDGSLYILDMYREVIEHPDSLPPLIKKHLDLTSGRDRGRIYRVIPDGFKQPPLPKLSTASPEVLVNLLQHPNGWHRDTAGRLLYERQDKTAIPLLVKLANDSQLPLARLHALYALAGMGALTPDLLLPRLKDPHPRLREHALRLAEKHAASPAIRQQFVAMTADSELRVRYQLAFSLGEFPPSPDRTNALATLIKKDAADPYFRAALLSSLGEGAGEMLTLLGRDAAFPESNDDRDFIAALATQIGKQQRPEDIALALKLLTDLAKANSTLLPTIVQRLAARSGTPLAQQIATATGGKAEQLMQALLAQSAQQAASEAAPLKSRIAAVEQLRLGTFAAHRDLLASLLAPTVPTDLQAAVLATLASYSAPEVVDLVLHHFAAFSPRLKAQATDLLFSRPAWALTLLAAMESGQVSTGELDPVRLKMLSSHKDDAIRTKATRLLASNQLSRRADVVESYRGVLEMPGDTARGKLVFTKICAACHRVQGVGSDLGPNLAAMKARGPEAILLNVLDPNREVNPQYLSYSLLTTDGRQLTGMIAAETATSVTLRRGDNATDTILRIDIDQLKSTGMSLMPEGMEKQLDRPALADLLEYLKTAE